MLSPKKTFTWSLVAIFLLGLTILYHLSIILQVKYQLVSKFIPQSIIWEICKPNIIIALLTNVITGMAILLHIKKKYPIVIGGTAFVLILQEGFLFLTS